MIWNDGKCVARGMAAVKRGTGETENRRLSAIAGSRYRRVIPSGKGFALSLCMVLLALHALLFTVGHAELIDRVVACVNDRAITLSELRENYEKTKKIEPDITMAEVLNTMINRLLLLNDARRLKIDAKNDESVLNEYIELKVRAFIRVKEEDIEDYYKKNEKEFKGAPFESVRDKIEEYLTEKEINRLLKKQIAELRAKAYVKVLLKEPR
ncbi:MAG: hypothetical protein M1497_10780 [Nitrospirae bacterium]|nr:hypothetical protein [Nitrospirota bacterium]